MEQTPPEQEFRATYTDHANFAESAVWWDYHTELITQLSEIHVALETTESMDQIRQLQGAARALRQFLLMPSNIAELLEPTSGREIEGTEYGRE